MSRTFEHWPSGLQRTTDTEYGQDYWQTLDGGQGYQDSITTGAAARYKQGWCERNPEAIREKRLRDRYGLTVAEVEAAIEAQERRCKICGELTPLVVDHCHATGAFRGMLCQNCNAMLGMANDDPGRLIAAATYLEMARVPAPN
jgi:hypothetical protein